MALSRDARLLFIGMFSNADDLGRGSGSPASLKATIFPADEIALGAIAKLAAEISGHGMVYFYRGPDDPSVFYQLATWDRWQKPKYPTPSKLPAYQGRGGLGEASGKIPGGFPEVSSMRGEERVGLSVVERSVVERRSEPDHRRSDQAASAEPPAEPDTPRGQDSHFSEGGRRRSKAKAGMAPISEIVQALAGGRQPTRDQPLEPPGKRKGRLHQPTQVELAESAFESALRVAKQKNPQREAMFEKEPAWKKAVRAVGGWEALRGESPGDLRAAFLEATGVKVQPSAVDDAEEMGAPPERNAVESGKQGS
jgi:hypothetical protein